MPKDKTLLVESGKWHSKENQLVKHPRRSQKGVLRRDIKQKSIKSFCVKLHQKPVKQDKENQNADMMRHKLAPTAHYQQKSMSMACTPTAAFMTVDNQSVRTCTVQSPITKYDKEACVETQEQSSHKSAMVGRSQSVLNGTVSSDTKPTLMETTHLRTVTVPVFEDSLEGFCPMHTSTQISAINFNGNNSSESQNCSCAVAESQASPCAHNPDFSRYDLSMRFTQDSLGNPIFCRFSQKD